MKIDTPVASLAIRGTTVFTEISAKDGATIFRLLRDPDNPERIGSFQIVSKNGDVLATVSSIDSQVQLLSATSSPCFCRWRRRRRKERN